MGTVAAEEAVEGHKPVSPHVGPGQGSLDAGVIGVILDGGFPYQEEVKALGGVYLQLVHLHYLFGVALEEGGVLLSLAWTAGKGDGNRARVKQEEDTRKIMNKTWK